MGNKLIEIWKKSQSTDEYIYNKLDKYVHCKIFNIFKCTYKSRIGIKIRWHSRNFRREMQHLILKNTEVKGVRIFKNFSWTQRPRWCYTSGVSKDTIYPSPSSSPTLPPHPHSHFPLILILTHTYPSSYPHPHPHQHIPLILILILTHTSPSYLSSPTHPSNPQSHIVYTCDLCLISPVQAVRVQ